MITGNLQSILRNNKIISLSLLLITLIALLVNFLSSGIFYLYQFNYAVSDVYLDYLAGLIGSLFLIILIAVIPFRHKNLVLVAWIAKLSIVFFFDLLYEGRYYFLDAYSYFASAVKHPVFIPKLFDGTHNMHVLTSYITAYIYPSYRLCLVFFAFAGLMAQCLFYRAIVNIIPHASKKLLLIFLFFPSMIFWLASIFAVSLVLSFYINKNIKGTPKIFISIFLFAAGVYVLKLGLSKFQIQDWSQYVELLVRTSPAWSTGGSAQNITILTANDYLLNMPFLMFSTLFRPLFYEADNMFQLFAGIENVLLLLYVAGAMWYFLRYKLFKNSIIMIMLIHIIIWCFVYAPLSAQNLGTAVRYKLQILPFLLAFIYLTFHYKNEGNREKLLSGNTRINYNGLS